MGRHTSDNEESLGEKITGPFRRIRNDDTQPSEFETKRRTWPIALILGSAVAAAVGIPWGLMNASPDPSPTRLEPAGRASLSASPVPTITKTVRETIKAGKPVPVPTETKTIFRTSPPAPAVTIYQSGRPAPTVTETIKVAVPGPTKTKRIEIPGPTVTETVRIRVRVCYGAWANGNYERIQCP
jgi:hypothetical protein